MTGQLGKKLFAVAMLLTSFAAQAQVYKWVDANGRVTYSDVAPPNIGLKVETRPFADADGPAVALPFELAQAVKNLPVVLYTSSPCVPCDDGRSFLKQNGIPFSEKTVATNADLEKLNKLSGGTQLPVLAIGKTKMKGYNFIDWRSSLTQAGYPTSNVLPANYQFPVAQPLAPLPSKTSAAPQTPAQPAEAPTRDPNGFQF